MIRLQKKGDFDCEYRELVKESSELKEIVAERVKWFTKNPDDTRLANHRLSGKLKGKWSFSITDDIRIVYKWWGKNSVIFLAIGSHAQAYRKGLIN